MCVIPVNNTLFVVGLLLNKKYLYVPANKAFAFLTIKKAK